MMIVQDTVKTGKVILIEYFGWLIVRFFCYVLVVLFFWKDGFLRMDFFFVLVVRILWYDLVVMILC